MTVASIGRLGALGLTALLASAVIPATANDRIKIKDVYRSTVTCECSAAFGSHTYTVKSKLLKGAAITAVEGNKAQVLLKRKKVKEDFSEHTSCVDETEKLAICWVRDRMVNAPGLKESIEDIAKTSKDGNGVTLADRQPKCEQHANIVGSGSCEKVD